LCISAPLRLRTAPYVDARTWPYVHVRQCTVTYGAGRQRNATCHTNRARTYCARLRTTTQCVWTLP